MARVFVTGATGGTGLRVCAALRQRGHSCLGLHRRPEQARRLEDKGIEAVGGDLSAIDEAALAEHLKGCDALVFAAGASEDGPKVAAAVDGRGVAVCLAAARRAGVARFLHVSAFPDAWRDQRMPDDFEHYMKVKRQADVNIAESELDWVIVRPGTLTNAKGEGRVRLGMAIPYGSVSRDDVAAVLAVLVEQRGIRRVILELTGGDTAIEDALRNAVHGRPA